MYSISPKTARTSGSSFFFAKFPEPKAGEFNDHFYSKVRHELRLIKEALEMHGYPLKKLNCREVWRIGKGDNLYLLSYYTDPFEWALLPHNDNLALIIAYGLTTA